MQENLTENNLLNKPEKSKFDSGETTYNDEKFPKTALKDEEKIKKIKLLQERINNENNLIEEYDTQLENLRNNKNKLENLRNNKNIGQSPVPFKKKSIFEKLSSNKTNKLINTLKLKSGSLYTKISGLAEKENGLNLNSSDILERNKNKDMLKKIKNEKEIIMNKINDIDNQNQIKLILDKEKMKNNSRYNLQKDYTKNIEEKNYFFQKSPKQIKTSPSSFLESLEKAEKKLQNEKSVQEELKRKEKFENLRSRELAIVRMRKKKFDELAKVNYPKYIPKKDYITAEENELKRKRYNRRRK